MNNKNVIIAALLVIGLFFGAFALFNNTKQDSQTLSSLTPFPTFNPNANQINRIQTIPTPSVSLLPTPTESTSEIAVAKRATIKTSKGTIVLTLFPDKAPKTVANFVKRATSGFYKNLTFHRVEDWVIQGGDPAGNGTGGGNMPTELDDASFVKGSLGVARGGDIKISNDSQFFIVKKDATWLDRQYTNFGIVESGMDVVDKIEIGDKILDVSVE